MLNGIDGIPEGVRDRVVQGVIDSAGMNNVLGIIARIEAEQLRRLRDLQEAVGVDHIETVPDPDERQEMLGEMIQAVVAGDFETWHLKRVADGADCDPDDLRPYLGMPPEDYADQISEWASAYRNRAPTDLPDRTDADLAEVHIEGHFGLSIEEFERFVVDYERGRAAERAFAGNLKAVGDGIDLVREAVEADGAGADADEQATDTEGD